MANDSLLERILGRFATGADAVIGEVATGFVECTYHDTSMTRP